MLNNCIDHPQTYKLTFKIQTTTPLQHLFNATYYINTAHPEFFIAIMNHHPKLPELPYSLILPREA